MGNFWSEPVLPEPSAPVTPSVMCSVAQIPRPDPYLKKVVKYHTYLVNADYDLLTRQRWNHEMKKPLQLEGLLDSSLQDVFPKISKHKFTQDKIFTFLQDMYTQDLFEFYVADIRNIIETVQIPKDKETILIILKDQLNNFVRDVIENRVLPSISESNQIKTAIKKPSDWYLAFWGIYQIVEKVQKEFI